MWPMQMAMYQFEDYDSVSWFPFDLNDNVTKSSEAVL